MDEAEAFAKMLQAGGTAETITYKSGLSALTVKRRLALAALCPEAKKAFRAGTITRGFAEALTLGTALQQRAVLESVDDEMLPTIDDVRTMLTEQKPALSMAIFPRDRDTGTITTDLFADAETSYFDDTDQFLSLQKEAVEALAEQYRQTAAWVEVSGLYNVPWWRFRDAAEGEAGGAVINLHPSGSVELREGLVPHEVRPMVVETPERTPIKPRPVVRERPEFAAPLIRYVAAQKSAAVQAALLEHRRKAKEIAALLLLLGLRVDYGLRLSIHDCHGVPREEQVGQRAYREIAALADHLANCLGNVAGPGEAPAKGGLRQLAVARSHRDLLQALARLTDQDLALLVIMLPILCFGQSAGEQFDIADSLFNIIAQNIGLDIRSWWLPDAAFLSALRHDQVLVVAEESGAVEKLHGIAKRTKRETVGELARYFAGAAAAPTPENEKATSWLPGFFEFPPRKCLSAKSND